MARTNLHLVLERLLLDFEPTIRNAFLIMVQDVQDEVVLRDLIAAIQNAEFDRAFDMLGLDGAAMRPLTEAIEQAYEEGGVATFDSFPRRLRSVTGAKLRFDVRAMRAERYLRDHSSRLVTEITEKTREAVKGFLTEGMKAGQNPKAVALDLVGRMDRVSGNRVGGVLGLTQAQHRWVANTRTALVNLDASYFDRELRPKQYDDIVRRAIAEKRALDAETVQRLVTLYESNALRYRGRVVGRTEAIRALNHSQHEALKQAVDAGAFSASAVKRIWDSTGPDGRTRDSHLIMEGQTVGLDEPFIFPGLGHNQAMFPADDSLGADISELAQCRCRVRIDIDYFEGVD